MKEIITLKIDSALEGIDELGCGLTLFRKERSIYKYCPLYHQLCVVKSVRKQRAGDTPSPVSSAVSCYLEVNFLLFGPVSPPLPPFHSFPGRTVWVSSISMDVDSHDLILQIIPHLCICMDTCQAALSLQFMAHHTRIWVAVCFSSYLE